MLNAPIFGVPGVHCPFQILGIVLIDSASSGDSWFTKILFLEIILSRKVSKVKYFSWDKNHLSSGFIYFNSHHQHLNNKEWSDVYSIYQSSLKAINNHSASSHGQDSIKFCIFICVSQSLQLCHSYQWCCYKLDLPFHRLNILQICLDMP